MSVMDFSKASRVFYGGVEVKEVWSKGVRVWAKLNPIVVSVSISGTGVQGTEHTVVYEVDGTPAPTVNVQWFLNDSPLYGEVGESFTPPIPMIGELFARVTAVNTAGSSWADTDPVSLGLSTTGGTIRASTADFDYVLFSSSSSLGALGSAMATVLAIAGGGAGGFDGGSGDPIGGGGGAGGVILTPFAMVAPSSIVIGDGGNPAISAARGAGAPGTDTTGLGLDAKGGGGGGQNYSAAPGPVVGSPGGSGGGGPGTPITGPATGGAGTPGQGNGGGTGFPSGSATFRRGAGGGGFFGVGTDATASANGRGGAGLLFSDVLPEDFATVATALGLTGAFAGFAAGGGGGTGQATNGSGGAGTGGLGGGGTGGNSAIFATGASSYGSAGGGAGDAADYGGAGYDGLFLAVIPKKGLNTKLSVWFSDDTYRDDDGSTAMCIAVAFGKHVSEQFPHVEVKGIIEGDAKVGAQWFILNPDADVTGLPSGYNDGDTRYSNTASNKVAGGNRWFLETHLMPVVEDVLPSWETYLVWKNGASDMVHEWNFNPTQASQIHPASLAVANSIVAAIQNPQEEIVVYSAGGGANVAAEAIAYVLNTQNCTKADILPHFAIVQHGRSNFANGYDIRGGIDSRDITREFHIAITNQNDVVYSNGWAGPNLTNAFRPADLAHVDGTFISPEFDVAIKTALGVTAASGVPSNSTFTATRDASDAGSHAFALNPGRVVAAMPSRMTATETLQSGTENQHLIYDSLALTSRTRVLWHEFRNSAVASMLCGGA